MRIEHALGMAGGARGVAKARRGVLVELRPAEIAVGFADPVLVGDGVLQFGRRHVLGVGEDDVALDGRQLVGDRFEQRHEGQVDERHAVFGVVHDPDDLLDEQAWIDGVIDRADAGDAVPGLQVAVPVPRQGGDAVARLDPVARQALGDAHRARAHIPVVGAMDRALHQPRHHFPIRMLDRGEVDDLVNQQRPFLHQP